MNVHPDVTALMGDCALQRRASGTTKAAMEAWRAAPDVVRVTSELDAFAGGAGLDTCPQLCAIIQNHSDAEHFTQAFIEKLIQALDQEPLGEVPL
jgi:hypothetical protein